MWHTVRDWVLRSRTRNPPNLTVNYGPPDRAATEEGTGRVTGEQKMYGREPEGPPARYRPTTDGMEAVARADDDAGLDLTADALIRGLFAIGLDLHTALAHLEQRVAVEIAVARVRDAIARLDEAIRDIREATFGRRPDETPAAGGMRSMVVDAVGRACGPAGRGPVITLRSGVDPVIDTVTSRRLAALIQHILTLVPDDRLPRAHVEVRPDPRPPGRLVVQIDVPGDDLRDLARLLGAAHVYGVAVSSHAVTGASSGSRIRLEYPAAS